MYSTGQNYMGHLIAKNIKKSLNQCTSHYHKYYEKEIAQKNEKKCKE
jgi:hypothetical protein